MGGIRDGCTKRYDRGIQRDCSRGDDFFSRVVNLLTVLYWASAMCSHRAGAGLGQDKAELILGSKSNTLGNYFFMRLKSDKSYLLWRSVLNTENVSTRLKVKMLRGKYVFLQVSLAEREAVEDGCPGKSLECWCPVGSRWEGAVGKVVPMLCRQCSGELLLWDAQLQVCVHARV